MINVLRQDTENIWIETASPSEADRIEELGAHITQLTWPPGDGDALPTATYRVSRDNPIFTQIMGMVGVAQGVK